MPPATNDSFRTWINSNNMINLIFYAAVVCMTYEGITKFLYLTNYNNKSIEYFPTTREEKMTTITDNTVAGITAETALPGAKIY